MSNPFDVSHMAAGYAQARPAVHAHIIDRLRDWLGLAGPVDTAVDIGCGAGLSALALRRDAKRLIGLDPDFYLEYVLTETNVAAAVRAGVPADEVREWCRHTLAAAFPTRDEVLFRAYLALVVHA